MELTKNPFYILSASPRDGRRRLMELTEERSLLLDADECRDAYSVLTNPRKRLAAEVSWFPGVTPQKIEELLALMESEPEKILAEDSLPSLTRANLLAEGLNRLSAFDASAIASWIIAIDEAFDSTDAENVLSLLNAERVAAGFPEICDVTQVEEELENCRYIYRTAIKKALDKLPSRELVKTITLAVEETTWGGTLTINEVLIDVVDLYEIEAQDFLSKEEENIDRLIERIKAALKSGRSDTHVKALVEHLKRVVKNWDMVAQPVQLSAKSRGLNHDASQRVGAAIRELSLHLFNEYNKIELSQELTALMLEVFAEVDKLAEVAAEDAETLEKISRQRVFDAFLNPIHELCIETFKFSKENPSSADVKIRELMLRAYQMIKELNNVIPVEDSDLIGDVKDKVALTILSCTIIYGNETKKWSTCFDFLKEAGKYATSPSTISKIDRNMGILKDNINNYSELMPIKSAPGLWTVYGTGFTLYGRTDYHSHNNSYVATYYFVFLGIPIFPIARYRVINSSEDYYRFLGKAPFRLFDKLHLVVSIGVIFMLISNM